MEHEGRGTKHLWWVRRDLSITSLAAQAAATQGTMAALLVLDPSFTKTTMRHAWYSASAAALHQELAGHLDIRAGIPEEVIPAFVHEHHISDVYVTAEYTPYGMARDTHVEHLLAARGVDFHRVGSPYLVPPGTLHTREGHPFSRFTPFFQAWIHCIHPEVIQVPTPIWLTNPTPLPYEPLSHPYLPVPGHSAAVHLLHSFVDTRLASYVDSRDRPDLDSTSGLSPYLKVGSLHPQDVINAISPHPSRFPFLRQLAWREFFADLLYHAPESVSRDWSPTFNDFPWEDERTRLAEITRWKAGMTGYPLVDAGMRELLATGTMHNRVRMVVASFLVKDLNVHWSIGSRHFMNHLIDGDLASNTHNWQWVAGTGADAAPYFRIFNPTLQAERFDPEGSYIHRFIPELASLPVPDIFMPWKSNHRPRDYPFPIVSHDEAQRAAKARYHVLKASLHADRNS
ncbi:MAG: cryptochrome/photolyase family protein [Candidatus Dormibacteria bacterium]